MSALPSKNNTALPPTAPRLTGNAPADFTAVSQWFNQFIQTCYRENKLLDPEFQANEGEFDGTGSLPDPAQTSIAQAQYIANLAYLLGLSVQNDIAAKFPVDAGQFTISEANNQASIAFSADEEDTSYFVFCQPVSLTGSPASGAHTVKQVDKTVSGFTVTLVAAPGAGTSVTYDFMIFRNTE